MVVITIPDKPVAIRPVGVVVSDFKECSFTYDYSKESMICMREDLIEALTGLESFSHMHVIYHHHRREELRELTGYIDDEHPLTISIPGEPNGPGIYFTRSPFRPSALGSCVVEIVRREGNRIYVKGLDALDGTPVLDIKVYIPQYDAIPFAEAPLSWKKTSNVESTSRRLNWDTINVGLALGLRTGSRALQVLGLKRGEALRAEVEGGHFFAQGIEGATGCSFLREEILFTESNAAPEKWCLRLVGRESEVVIRLQDHMYSGANEVLEADDNTLFSLVKRQALK